MPVHKEYRRKWAEAGYKNGMASARACLPPRDSTDIRVYHLTATEHAISNLVFGRLKLSRFADLNDPFELLAMSLHESGIRTEIKNFKTTYNQTKGLLCFSEDWAEPLLWSHYASKHSGICLGFDIARSKLQKVNYEAARILSELGNDIAPKGLSSELQQQLLCTKWQGWKYEKEQRMFIPVANTTIEGGLNFVPLEPDLKLREVILGPLCKEPLDSVRKLVASLYEGATVYKSRLAFKSFNVVPDASTVP